MSGAAYPGLWRQFTTTPTQSAMLQAQVYAVAQTAAMKLPPSAPFSGTYTFSLPLLLSDGSWVSQWCPGPDNDPAPADPLATAWNSAWTVSPYAATTIDSATFIARFTSTEQTAVVQAAQSTTSIAQLIGMLEGAGVVDVTQPEVTSGVADLVTANAITQARATQILNLTQTSP